MPERFLSIVVYPDGRLTALLYTQDHTAITFAATAQFSGWSDFLNNAISPPVLDAKRWHVQTESNITIQKVLTERKDFYGRKH